MKERICRVYSCNFKIVCVRCRGFLHLPFSVCSCICSVHTRNSVAVVVVVSFFSLLTRKGGISTSNRGDSYHPVYSVNTFKTQHHIEMMIMLYVHGLTNRSESKRNPQSIDSFYFIYFYFIICSTLLNGIPHIHTNVPVSIQCKKYKIHDE